jgi:hypothetical protein
VTEQLIYSLSTLVPAQPTIIFLAASFVYLADDKRIWKSLDKTISASETVQAVPYNRNFDSVLYQLPVVKHYGLPYVSAIDGFGPFLSTESQTWLTGSYLLDTMYHLTRTGHKIVASLLLNYINLANASVHHPLFSVADAEGDETGLGEGAGAGHAGAAAESGDGGVLCVGAGNAGAATVRDDAAALRKMLTAASSAGLGLGAVKVVGAVASSIDDGVGAATRAGRAHY